MSPRGGGGGGFQWQVHKGPFILYEVRGAGGIWGFTQNKNGLKGGAI